MARSSIASIAAHLPEQSTAVFTVAFKDEDGAAVEPKSITWDLSDVGGNIINEREGEVIITPAETVNIVLSGDDLKISAGFSGETEERVLTVEAVYDSDLGNDLPLKSECHFYIDNLIKI